MNLNNTDAVSELAPNGDPTINNIDDTTSLASADLSSSDDDNDSVSDTDETIEEEVLVDETDA